MTGTDVHPAGSPARLSILDQATIDAGSSAARSLTAATELARHAETWGCHRFWVAEHHGAPGLAGSAPAVLIAHIAALTRTIRVGSGGVMLPLHAPLAIAEQFGTLHALHPGRIDLGVGRGPGADPVTAAALRRDAAAPAGDEYARQLAELTQFLDASFPPGHRYATVRAQPGTAHNPGAGRPPLWLLSTSEGGARLAGQLGLPYVFLRHASRTGPAIEAYRAVFRPSAVLAEPYVMLAVNVVAAEQEQHARLLACAAGLAVLRSGSRPLPAPTGSASRPRDPAEEERLQEWLSHRVIGEGTHVAAQLKHLGAAVGADEVMISCHVHGDANRRRSYELIARAYGVTPLPRSPAPPGGDRPITPDPLVRTDV
ncbi:LLM class flavin-dependent oxidoreductase [Nonomuraea sp. NPDC026600]|uniref:LLM class flavin-dependent oxidoreductase n=1 Tax=Nonomuraea sp. NPDC026600 TaxID=3155363 RepID=UPI0033CDEFA1